MGRSVDILIPMLGRATAIERLVGDVMSSYDREIDYRLLFLASESDRAVVNELHHSGEEFVVLPDEPQPGDYARKINTGFDVTDAEWLLLGASDIHLHEGWASAALEVGDMMEVGVVGTNDLGNPTVMKGGHSTHAVVRRDYIERFGGGWDGPGVVYHEGYAHQYCDTELVTCAQARGQWAFAHDSKVEHLHPYWRKGQMDDTYKRGLATSREDAALFQERSRALA